MDKVLDPIKKYLLKSDPANIDNWCFQLHYRATLNILIASMMLVGSSTNQNDLMMMMMM